MVCPSVLIRVNPHNNFGMARFLKVAILGQVETFLPNQHYYSFFVCFVDAFAFACLIR
jgi:hypothetical protein